MLKPLDNPHATDAPDPERPAPRRLLLEPIGAAVLLLVVLSLSWMIFTAHAPGLMRLASLEIEVMIVVGVLVAALVLVSVVALLHTRDR